MPKYEYRCKDCDETLEVVQAFTDDALTECPSCKGALKKVFGNVGISFKGSGFYKNDSRSDSGGGNGSKSTSSSSSTTTKSDVESSNGSSKETQSSSDSSKSTNKAAESTVSSPS